jgi:hypothetical protein
MEFKSGRDIEKWEDQKGYKRLDPYSNEARRLRDTSMDEHNMYRDRANRDGEAAAFDYMDKVDVQATTGWSDSQYAKHKETTDAVESAIAAK